MNQVNRKKTIIYILAAAILIVILSVVGLRLWIWQTGVEMCSGQIVKLDEKGFVLENRRGENITIIIGPETKILEGRKGIPEQSLVGERVFVVSSLNGQNEIEARVIRIIKQK